MISLEQIRTLESKVNQAVSLLAALQEENQQLKAKLAQAKSRIEELEFTVEEYHEDQAAIEQGIMSALQHLDHLENAVGGLKPAETPAVQAAVAETIAPAPQPAPPSAPIEEPAAPAAPAPVVAEVPAPAAVAEHWDAPVQQFQAPLPASEESYESSEPAAEEEAEEAPSREPQLDIF